MSTANNKQNVKYKCPFCDSRFTRDDLVIHVDKKHDDMIPEGYSAFRVVFDYVNKKPAGYNGKCIICGEESGWNEEKGKYNRICDNPECKKKYIEKFESNMMKTKGTTRISSTAEGQAKMLANRKISGKYKFADGIERTYTGTYEKKALEFMDKVLGCKGEDVITPGPIMEYMFEGKKHIYIPDIYYAPYNLIIEVKDGGDNPNNRNMPSYRAKQIAKEEYIIKNTDFNYLRLTNNNFAQLLSIFAELKMQMVDDSQEGSRVIRINEGIISDRLQYPYKYGEAKKINEELANKINSTDYYWYFINLTELLGSTGQVKYVDINLYGYDEEPEKGVNNSNYKKYNLYNKKAKAFHGTDSLNPSLRKYAKSNKGAAKTKEVVLKESVVLESKSNNLYFLSDKNNINKLVPRIPDNFLTKNGYEDNTTKRVCFSTSIEKCLTALSQNCKDKEFYVYQPDGDYKVISPTVDQVPDVKITNEKWICENVNVICIGKILCTGDDGKAGKKYTYGDNKEAELYGWKYKWIEKNVSESVVLESDNYTYLDIKSNKSKVLDYLNNNSETSKYAHEIINNYNGEIIIYQNSMIGRIFIGDKKDKGFITDFSVDEEYRGNGLGSKLLNDAINKYKGYDLLVDKSNTLAINMYKKRGFEIIKTIGDQYYMKLKSSTNSIQEMMTGLTSGYMPGFNGTYIVNYMQNNVFSNPDNSKWGISDNIRLTNIITRNKDGILSRVDNNILKDKIYKVFAFNKSVKEVSELLAPYMNTEVSENFLYEKLTGKTLYTSDQVYFDENFKEIDTPEVQDRKLKIQIQEMFKKEDTIDDYINEWKEGLYNE